MLFMLNSSAPQMLNKKSKMLKKNQIGKFGLRKIIIFVAIIFFFIYFLPGM